MKKRGQFFSIDVFVAVAIIAVGIVILFSSKETERSPTQTAALSRDLMSSMDSLKVYEVDNAYVQNLTKNGTVLTPSNTLLQQICEFYYYGRADIAGNITRNVTQGILPGQYAYSLTINNTLIYQTRPLDLRSPNQIVSKRIVSGVRNATEYWGPLTVEVLVWR